MTCDQTSARRILVTGGSSGIGAAAVAAFAKRGDHVAFTYNSGEASAAALQARLCEETPKLVAARLPLDATEGIAAVIAELVNELGGLDVLVNNAGINHRAQVEAERWDAWRRVLSVDLTGPMACTQAALPALRDSAAGRVVNVTSVLAATVTEGSGAYAAAKAGLEHLTRVTALELARYGITVNNVAPGHAATPMNDLTDAEAADRPVIPLGRAAVPEEIVAAIVFLASQEASYITGATLLVDGGLNLVSGPEMLRRSTGK